MLLDYVSISHAALPRVSCKLGQHCLRDVIGTQLEKDVIFIFLNIHLTCIIILLFFFLFTGSSGSNCSKNEGRKSGGSGSESDIRSHRAPSERSVAPPSERSVRSSVSHRSANSHSIAYGPGLVYGPPGLPPQPPHLSTAAPGAPPGRELASVPPELTASRQSLRMAVGNAGEFFVDVM